MTRNMEDSKIALVTGASRGIGRGIALELAKAGYGVAVNYARNLEAACEVVQEIRKIGPPAESFGADIGQSDDRNCLVQEVMERFGRIDLLVNNAGIAPRVRGDILEASEEGWDEVLDTNLKGPYFLTQLVAREMIGLIESRRISNAKIVFITSISAWVSSINRGDYCISKAGLSMASKLFAHRLAEYGINVYEIQPGIVETDMTEKVKEKYDKLLANDLQPINRWGRPEDVGKAVAAIASGYFDFTTGVAIGVDGGFGIRRL